MLVYSESKKPITFGDAKNINIIYDGGGDVSAYPLRWSYMGFLVKARVRNSIISFFLCGNLISILYSNDYFRNIDILFNCNSILCIPPIMKLEMAFIANLFLFLAMLLIYFFSPRLCREGDRSNLIERITQKSDTSIIVGAARGVENVFSHLIMLHEHSARSVEILIESNSVPMNSSVSEEERKLYVLNLFSSKLRRARLGQLNLFVDDKGELKTNRDFMLNMLDVLDFTEEKYRYICSSLLLFAVSIFGYLTFDSTIRIIFRVFGALYRHFCG
jgi:hypothetical protein